MKAAAHQVAGILTDPSRLSGILLHGDDWSLVRNRATAATVAVIGVGKDPFRLSILSKEEHGRLAQDVRSLSLGGGRRVVRVQDATDSLTAALERLADCRSDTLIIAEAAALTPRSKLRTMAEKLSSWASIACYPERAASVAAEITRVLAAAGIRPEPDALSYLSTELAGESGRRRAELEKLTLYAAGDGAVSLADAQACCAAELETSLAAAVDACLSGDVAGGDALLFELARDGASGAGILAVLSNQVHRLVKVRAVLAEGRSPEEATRGLMPPLFGQQLASFHACVERWSLPALLSLGRAIHDADIACKRAGSPDLAIAGHLLQTVAKRRSRRD